MVMSMTTLQPQNFEALPIFAGKSKKQRRLEQLNRRQTRKHQQQYNTGPFPKSTLTPLLIDRNMKPYPKTKLEALDDVVKDVELSMEKGVGVETQTYSSLLEVCYQLNSLGHGIRIHRVIPEALLRRNVGISSKLVRLYASCGLVDEAQQVFDAMCERDGYAFAWNALIAGYTELGMYEDALAIYFQMEEEGVERDRFTFPRALRACGGIGSIGVGQAVHRDLVRCGFCEDAFVMNALVDMYAKCGDIVKARRMFDKIDIKDSVSWNSMITSYVRHGVLIEALHIFRAMVSNGIELDSITISSILAGASTSLKIVVQIHGWVLRRGMEWDLSVANSLILAYANCGNSEQARWLFHQMPERDVVSWNTIISAHSKCEEALTYLEQMEHQGFSPDKITFVSLLSACARVGLVKEGERLFSSMKNKYNIKPIMEHYASMVNLYARAGQIDEAYTLIIEEMEIEAGPTVWGSLLYGCYLHGNVDIGEIAARCLFELEPDNEHNFELLMKLYDKMGRSQGVERVRKMMVDRGL